MSINLDSSTPVAPAGYANVSWQKDISGNVSASLPSVGGVLTKVANYTTTASDCGKLHTFNSAGAVTLLLPATAPFNLWSIDIQNTGVGTLTINPNTNHIDGSLSSLSLTTGQGIVVFTDGSSYFTMRGLASSGGGSTGATGPVGATGTSGASGATGPSGSPGGATGSTGPAGASGTPGSNGATGATGPSGGGGGGAATVQYASLLGGVVLDCDLSTGGKIGGGTATDNTTAIQTFLNTATQATPVHLIMDGPSLVAGLEIVAAGYTTIEGLGEDCGFYLKNSSGATGCIFSNRPGSIPGSRGQFVQIRNLSVNCNGPNNASNTYGIWISNIDHLVFENLRIFNNYWFNLTFENCGEVLCNNIRAEGNFHVNQDGIHIFGPANDVRISNCSFYEVGDDAIALNAPEGYGGTITRVTVDNCNFYAPLTFMRIYSVGSSSYTVDNVAVSNCVGYINNSIGIADGVGFRIGNGGVGTNQDWIRHLQISNTRVCGVGFMEFTDNTGDVDINNCTWICNAGGAAGFYFNTSSVSLAHLSLNNFTIYRDVDGSTVSNLLSMANGCLIKRLSIRGLDIADALNNTTAGLGALLNTNTGTISDLDICDVNPNFIANIASDYANITNIGGAGCYPFILPDSIVKVGNIYLSANSGNLPTMMTLGGPVQIFKGTPGVLHSGSGSPPVPSIAVVQSKSGTNDTITLSFTSSVSAGNLLVAIKGAAFHPTMTNTQISDSLGNIWTRVTTISNSGSANGTAVGLWWTVTENGGSETVNFSDFGANDGMVIMEISGCSPVVDVFNTGTSMPSLITTFPYDALFSAVFYDSTSAATVSGGETLVENSIGSVNSIAASFEEATSSPGSITSSLAAPFSPAYLSVAFKPQLLGNDGDWYIDTSTGALYGPRVNGSWTLANYGWLSSTGATGSTVVTLGTNCPASNTVPYKWYKFYDSDGSEIWVPGWKN